MKNELSVQKRLLDALSVIGPASIVSCQRLSESHQLSGTRYALFVLACATQVAWNLEKTQYAGVPEGDLVDWLGDQAVKQANKTLSTGAWGDYAAKGE